MRTLKTTDRVSQFAEKNLKNKKEFGEDARLAFKRHLNDLKRSKKNSSSFPYVFVPEKAEEIIELANKLTIAEGDGDQNFICAGFQEFILGSLFGWVHKETGKRRFTDSYVQVSRQQGKSVLNAILGIKCSNFDNYKHGQIYCTAASALTGMFTDPRTLGGWEKIEMPKEFLINDNMIVPPIEEALMETVEIQRGPNIKPFPIAKPLEDSIQKKAILKVGDNITTDHIMPAGSKILPYRSNIPYLSQFCFGVCDKEFPQRCKAEEGGIIIAGSNYGQGSSREHAALVPLYLGIKAVVAKSYARIHCANLANAGIIPLEFTDESDYDKIDQMDDLCLPHIKEELQKGCGVTMENLTKGTSYKLTAVLTERQQQMVLAGGLLNYTKTAGRE